MADLSTTVAGLTLPNPIIAASCEATMTEAGIAACLDAGAGAVIAKSVNESPDAQRQLDIADYTLLDDELRPIDWSQADGSETLFNRSGLAQTSLKDWLGLLERSNQRAAARGAMVFGSITVASADGAARIARRMAEVVPAIELNVGAPHGRESSTVRQLTDASDVAYCVRAVRAATHCPLIVKLPGQASDITGMADVAVREGADAVTLIGRLNGFVPNLDTWQPEMGSFGAIGGRWMLPISLYWASKSRRALPAHIPIIGTNGVRNGRDVARFLLAGANAVQLATLLLIRGAIALADVITELDDYLNFKQVARAGDMIGSAAHRAREYSELVTSEPIVRTTFPWSHSNSATHSSSRSCTSPRASSTRPTS